MNNSKFLALIVATTRESSRNKLELFFNLFFPLLFMLLFGFMLAGADDYRSERVGYLGAVGSPLEQVIRSSGAWEPVPYGSEARLRADLSRGKIAFGISANGSKLRYFSREDDIRQAGKLTLARLTIDTEHEKRLNKIRPLLTPQAIPITAGKQLVTRRDYVLTGILSISLLSAGMMAVVSIFGRYRKSGILRRLQTTPVRPVTFVMGMTFSRLIISFASILLILFASMLIFKPAFSVNWPLLLVTILCSTLGMMSLGLLLTVLFRNPETANTTAGILMFVMHFLAGIFFPLSLLPDYLRVFSTVLPLKYVSELLRHSLGVEMITPLHFTLNAAGLALSGMILLWLVGRKFLRPE